MQRGNMTDYHYSGNPTKSGHYRVWELCSGVSLEVQWDNDKQAWMFPPDWEEDPNYGNVVSIWCEL